MTNERARLELEQLYISLSEEKKQALDVAFREMQTVSKIKDLISIPMANIEKEVPLKYKAICEVIKNETNNRNVRGNI